MHLIPDAVETTKKGEMVDVAVEITAHTGKGGKFELGFLDVRGASAAATKAFGKGLHKPNGLADAPMEHGKMKIKGLRLNTSGLKMGVHVFALLVSYSVTSDKTLEQETRVFKCVVSDPKTKEDRASMASTAPYSSKRNSKPSVELLEKSVFKPPKASAKGAETAFLRPNRIQPNLFVEQASLQIEPALTKFANIVSKSYSGKQFEANYAKLMETLLMAEECQMDRDIQGYDISNAKFTKENNKSKLFRLAVQGLAEGRPTVLRGDTIVVRINSGKQNTTYRGRVEVVEAESVLVAFHDKFAAQLTPGMTCALVRFEVAKVLIDLQHEAIKNVLPKYKSYVLPGADKFALDTAFGALKLSDDGFHLQNPALNPEQVLAVRSALAWKPEAKSPFVIFGPPGTGKTTTVVEIAAQLFHSGERVLIMASSNTACDLFIERVVEFGKVPKSKALRLCSFSRNPKSASKLIKGLSNFDANRNEFVTPTKEKLANARVVAMTCMCAARLRLTTVGGSSTEFILKDKFENVIIDEAGHSTEPEILAGIVSALHPNGRLILAGDPRQLGPVVHSKIGQEHSGISLLERLCMPPPFYPSSPYAASEDGSFDSQRVCMLTRNYRSHPALIALPSERFYFGKLTSHAGSRHTNIFMGWSELPNKTFPMVFNGVKGEELREGNSPSFFNRDEIICAVEWIQKILGHSRAGIKAEDIAVVTPYHKQHTKMMTFLARKKITGVHVGSAELLQGQEYAVVIITTTRSDESQFAFDVRHNLGFLCNPKRFNVAITRAKALMIVIGNPATLYHDENWRALIDRCLVNNAYVGCDFDGAPSTGALFPETDAGNEELAKQLNDIDETWRKLDCDTSYELIDPGEIDDT